MRRTFEAVLNDKALKNHLRLPRPVHSYVGELIYRRDSIAHWPDWNKVPEDVDARHAGASSASVPSCTRRPPSATSTSRIPRISNWRSPPTTIIAEIPTNRPRDVIPYQVSIAETALQAGDTARAEATATETLKLIDQPGSRERATNCSTSSAVWPETEDYAKAVTILEQPMWLHPRQAGQLPEAAR